MGKLIDADEFVEWLLADAITDEQRKFAEKVRYAAEKMKPVDAVPVRRGKWIRIPQEEMFCCDQCGRRGLSFEEVDVYGYTHDPFCADCGARMDGNHHEG